MYPCESSILDSVHDDVQDDGTPVHIAIDEREAENNLPNWNICYLSAVVDFVVYELCWERTGLSFHYRKAAQDRFHLI